MNVRKFDRNIKEKRLKMEISTLFFTQTNVHKHIFPISVSVAILYLCEQVSLSRTMILSSRSLPPLILLIGVLDA